MNSEWDFIPLAKNNEIVVAGSWLGEVKEKNIPHKIMVPFTLEGEYRVQKIVDAGGYKITDAIATLEDKKPPDRLSRAGK